MSDMKELMKGMVGSFNPEAARVVDARVQLNASGEGGGPIILTIKDGQAGMAEGVADDPDVTLDVSVTDWAAIVNGELDPTRAYMTGKLKILGDIGLMMKFQRMFGR